MVNRKRQGNNPKRRIASPTCLTAEERVLLAGTVRYIGSASHKLHPVAYGFPRSEPRPSKSLCDMVRPILLPEARDLVFNGIRHGMFSEPQSDGFPKYIWSVSTLGEVFEAKTDRHGTGEYHGYPLEDEDSMREHVLSVWNERCLQPGQ